MKLLNKKGQIVASMNALASVAIGFFVFFIVLFAVLKGASTIKATEPAGTIYNNMTKLEGSIGLFSQYSDLIVIVAILAIVISLVAGAFLMNGKR